jgi:U1 zinc finger
MSYRRKEETTGRWRDNNHYERHYCEICNVWISSDRASILTHQNGKKHAEKVQEFQAQKAKETAAQEKQQSALQKSLQQMEAAAAASFQQDYGLFAGSMGAAPVTVHATFGAPPPVVSSSLGIPHSPPPPPPVSSSGPLAPPTASTTKQEKKEWEARKHHRDEENKKKRNKDEEDEDVSSNSKRRKVKVGEADGHYPTADQLQTWLEGVVFGDILEEDMPIQVWLGNATVSGRELSLPENQRHWKDGLVAAVRHRPSAEHHADRLVVDIAYLHDSNDADEQLKRSVPLQHIRILLGNDADDRIPATLEEARLLAMGGEEIVLKQPKKETAADPAMEEATGLSGWSTVKIKRTTVRSELKEEREAERQKRKAAAAALEKQAKEAEARRMEEAKVSNANDSALGAYDVWSRTKDGYKGVNIHGTAEKTDVHEFGKKLAGDGCTVGFKKKSKAAAKKNQNRRTTSADGD